MRYEVVFGSWEHDQRHRGKYVYSSIEVLNRAGRPNGLKVGSYFNGLLAGRINNRAGH